MPFGSRCSRPDAGRLELLRSAEHIVAGWRTLTTRRSGHRPSAAARRRGKTSLQGIRPGVLRVGPSHPRVGHPLARRFSDCRSSRRSQAVRPATPDAGELMSRLAECDVHSTIRIRRHWCCRGESLWRSGRSGSPDRARRLWGACQLTELHPAAQACAAGTPELAPAARTRPRSACPATGTRIRIAT